MFQIYEKPIYLDKAQEDGLIRIRINTLTKRMNTKIFYRGKRVSNYTNKIGKHELELIESMKNPKVDKLHETFTHDLFDNCGLNTGMVYFTEWGHKKDEKIQKMLNKDKMKELL